MNSFNPKLKDMLEQNPEQSVIGFAWAIGWRLQLLILGIYFAFLAGIMFLAFIVDSILLG